MHRSCRLLGFLQSFDLELTRTQSSPCPRDRLLFCVCGLSSLHLFVAPGSYMQIIPRPPASGFSDFHTSLSLEICRSLQWPPDGKNLSVTLPDISSQLLEVRSPSCPSPGDQMNTSLFQTLEVPVPWSLNLPLILIL